MKKKVVIRYACDDYPNVLGCRFISEKITGPHCGICDRKPGTLPARPPSQWQRRKKC